MAGLLSPKADLMSGTMSAQRQGGGMMTQVDPPTDEAEEESNVSPEEQAEYERFVTAGFKLLYEGGKVRQSILEMLDDDPSDLIKVFGEVEGLDKETFGAVAALGATAATVVLELVRKSKDKPDGAILLHGGQAILEDVAEIAVKANIHDFTQEEINQSMLVAMDFYRVAAEAEGLYDPADAEGDAAELKQADEEGRFFDLMPQLRQFEGGEAQGG